jgi:hypothetical protein
MNCSRVIAASLSLMLLAGLSGRARAQEAADPDEEDAPRGRTSYVAVSFFGGALLPFGKGGEGLEQGLSAGLRVGWTSAMGLGLDAVATYSPLPRTAVEGEQLQTIYTTAALTPRYTLGSGKVRASLAGGGGAAMDRTTLTIEGMPDTSETSWAPAVTGSAAVELHLLDGGGFFLGGAYTRLFGDLEYQYAEGQAGLIFTFD